MKLTDRGIYGVVVRSSLDDRAVTVMFCKRCTPEVPVGAVARSKKRLLVNSMTRTGAGSHAS